MVGPDIYEYKAVLFMDNKIEIKLHTKIQWNMYIYTIYLIMKLFEEKKRWIDWKSKMEKILFEMDMRWIGKKIVKSKWKCVDSENSGFDSKMIYIYQLIIPFFKLVAIKMYKIK